jgi:hypothetical protein
MGQHAVKPGDDARKGLHKTIKYPAVTKSTADHRIGREQFKA